MQSNFFFNKYLLAEICDDFCRLLSTAVFVVMVVVVIMVVVVVEEEVGYPTTPIQRKA